MIALAALLLWSAAAQEIAAPGAGGNSSYAYFVMVGPIDAARTYRPWLFSAVAMATKVEMCITDRFEHTAATARARGRHHCTDFHRVLSPRPFSHARRVG